MYFYLFGELDSLRWLPARNTVRALAQCFNSVLPRQPAQVTPDQVPGSGQHVLLRPQQALGGTFLLNLI